MNVKIFRHHVLEGIRSFVKDLPNSEFQEGYLNALEQMLQFVDRAEVPCCVFYDGTYRGRAGLTEAEVGRLCVGYYQHGSSELPNLPCRDDRRSGDVTPVGLRKHLLTQITEHEHDSPDSDFFYGYLAALQEMWRVLDNVPSWRLNFEPNIEPRAA